MTHGPCPLCHYLVYLFSETRVSELKTTPSDLYLLLIYKYMSQPITIDGSSFLFRPFSYTLQYLS